MSIINFDLLKNPLNWVTVILMVTIAGVVVTLLNEASGQTQ